jgi:hypothetical protein
MMAILNMGLQKVKLFILGGMQMGNPKVEVETGIPQAWFWSPFCWNMIFVISPAVVVKRMSATATEHKLQNAGPRTMTYSTKERNFEALRNLF